MKRAFCLLSTCIALSRAASADEPALTIYNQDFAVVRDTVPLDLKSGTNTVQFAGATSQLEPSSVVLRDPTGKRQFRIVEQNYRGDPVSQEALLTLNEGKTIQFEVPPTGGQLGLSYVSGKIIRSGTDVPVGSWQYLYANSGAPQPVIQVNGKLRFGLPGLPIFPAFGDDAILKPTLVWVIDSAESAKFDAEVSYVTGGLNWNSDYNLVLPERGDMVDFVGWVTMTNHSGRSFDEARIKLMAGDVNKIRPDAQEMRMRFAGGGGFGGAMPSPVTEKSFDEYHLYTLANRTSLHNGETKQVEFVRAADVGTKALYVYDGARLNPGQWVPEEINTTAEFGVACNKKVVTMREFTNSAANHLGLALPKGRVRLYRRNSDTQLEFVGENEIDHTPKDEVVRVVTGNAFDLVGERKRVDFRVKISSAIDPTTGLATAMAQDTNSPPAPWMDETFEITLRNHKREPVQVQVVEHLYRWVNWRITSESRPNQKKDAQTIQFSIDLKPDSEEKVTYTVHYFW